MAKKNIKKNYVYNLTYQILLLIAPLITTPYLSRILGASGIGNVSFAESIVSYFTLFASLGIPTYGQREISYLQDEKEKRTTLFWETKSLQFITSCITLIIYIPFALLQNNQVIFLILIFNLLSVMADVTWLFQGMEDFERIVLRNIIFKLISIVYIFTVVKTSSHVNRYVFGLSFFTFISNVALWFSLPKYVGKPSFRYIKTVISLFIPTIAIQIYTVLDKTMIGIITQNAAENGYYEQALKMSRIVLMVVTALGTVMIPRIGYHFSRGEAEKVNDYIYRGYQFVWFIGVPLCFGLIGVSSNFVPWFYGAGFEKVVPLLSILSFLILSIGINNVTGMQYLIPTKRQNLFTMTVLIGASVNFVMNIVLIYFFQSIGAAIASVAAETTIALVQLWFVREEYSIRKVFSLSRHYLIAGGVMLAGLEILGRNLNSSIFNTVLMVICGAVIYFLILLIFRDSFFVDNLKNVTNKVLKKKV